MSSTPKTAALPYAMATGLLVGSQSDLSVKTKLVSGRGTFSQSGGGRCSSAGRSCSLVCHSHLLFPVRGVSHVGPELMEEVLRGFGKNQKRK